MLDLVKKFFRKKTDENKTGDKSGHDVRVATCALLLEIASVDGEFSGEEQRRIISIMEQDYSLSGEYVKDLIEESHRERKNSIDLWQFTNLINKNYSKNEKVEIIEMVWKVIYADGHLDKHEDYLVHKLANLLRLTQKELINAKLKVLPKKQR
ncbi:MAG: hypothetical protein IEMM0002_0192 [bacterium]|nr:MAG: hypothetical protein IEMM0002_0192 [bacterium]